jgi:hypothetical protein
MRCLRFVSGQAGLGVGFGRWRGMVSAAAVSPPPEQGCLLVVKPRQLSFIGILAAVAVQSCASGSIDVGSGNSNQQGSGAAGGGGAGGGIGSLPDAAFSLPDAPPAGLPDLPPCPTGYQQDKDGNYFCCPEPLSILSIGQPAKYGADSGSGDSTDAFQAFMNCNTNGTATMEMLKTYKHITDLDLSKYDLVILQGLYNQIPYNPADLWTYTDADAAALRDWVKNQGGAVVGLSGYWSDQTIEIQPLNQLLNGSDHWSGITYNGDDTFVNCPDNMCYCTDSSVAFDGWQTSYADYPAITHDLKKVGVFHGRSISCTGSDCQVFAKDPAAGNVGVAKVVGKGHVFAWGDEWVTYTSQWGLTDTRWDTEHAECAGYTARTSYSVPQFWYNAFRWAVPDNTCFTIIVPPTAPPGQQIIP